MWFVGLDGVFEMSEMKPVAWCLMTNKGEIINGVHEEERLAAQYRHRQADDTMTPLYTADQLAEAVAAERERCAKVCGKLGGAGKSGFEATAYDPENRGADCAEDMAERIAEAIRSAAK